MAESKDLHIDAILTNLSVKYTNETLIWDQLMPIVKVNKRSDKYYVYTKRESYRLPDDRLGPKSRPNELSINLSTDNYSVNDWGLADWIPQEALDNQDNPLNIEVDTNEALNEGLSLAQEKRVADIVFAAATYPTGNKTQLSGTGQWGGTADAPISDILTAVETCFKRANVLVFGQAAWQKFRQLPEVLDAVKSTTRASRTAVGGLASMSEVASLFEVDKVLVGRAYYDTANVGQTASYSRLWGKHCAALHVVPSPGVRSNTFGVTFSEMTRQTQRDFDPKIGPKGAHYIKVAWNSDEKVISSDLGYFIEDAVA